MNVLPQTFHEIFAAFALFLSQPLDEVRLKYMDIVQISSDIVNWLIEKSFMYTFGGNKLTVLILYILSVCTIKHIYHLNIKEKSQYFAWKNKISFHHSAQHEDT